MLFQICTSFFILLKTQEDILKNMGNQRDDGSHWLPLYEKKMLWKSMATDNSLVDYRVIPCQLNQRSTAQIFDFANIFSEER